MTTIYGLRETGTQEFRYIGRSNNPLAIRLRKHRLNAARNYPPRISAWINAAAAIEIVPIAFAADEDCCATERALVEHYANAGHRLTNAHLLPRTPATSARRDRGAGR